MRILLAAALAALPAGAAVSALTLEKQAFARDNPCPASGKPSTTCTGFTIVYPACAPKREAMRWSLTWDRPHWVRQAAEYCACLAYPISVISVTTRGRHVQAVKCRLWAP